MKLEVDTSLITYRAPAKEVKPRQRSWNDRPKHPEAPALLLYTLRKTAGMTQAEAAKAIGVERTSVVNMEAQNQTVRFEYLDKLANFVGVELVLSIVPKQSPNDQLSPARRAWVPTWVSEENMGTNYYLHNKPDCPCCQRPYEPLHIGKSSGGWCFSLHVIPEDNINVLDDWRELWSRSGSFIRNEYGERVSVEEMERIITERAWRGEFPQRHEIDKFGHCIGHGEGPWDYITGWFS